MGTIRVKVGVGITMMRTVTTRPPFDGALNGTRAGESESVFEGFASVISAMCPKSVISRRNSQTSHKVPEDREEASLPHELGVHCTPDSNGRCDGDSEHTDPLQLLQDVLSLDWW